MLQFDPDEYKEVDTKNKYMKNEGVVVIQHIKTHQRYMFKNISKQNLQGKAIYRKYIETFASCEFPYNFNVPNVAKVFGCYENHEDYDMLIQYVGCVTLQNKIITKKNKLFSFVEAIQIIKPIIIVLSQKKEAKFIYNLKPTHIYVKGEQIKSQNIILSQPTCPQRFKKSIPIGKGWESIFIGEPIQCWTSDNFDLQKYQVWNLGVLFYLLLNGKEPFQNTSKLNDLRENCTNFSYCKSMQKTSKKIYDNCSIQIEDFFRRVFDPNPQKRISIEQILIHPLIFQFLPSDLFSAGFQRPVPVNRDDSLKVIRNHFDKAAFLLRFCQKVDEKKNISNDLAIGFKYVITLFAKNLIDEIMLEIPNEPDPSKIKNPYCSSLEQVKDYKTADLISRYKNCQKFLNPYSREVILNIQNLFKKRKQLCKKRSIYVCAEFMKYGYEFQMLDKFQNQKFEGLFKQIYRSCTCILYKNFLHSDINFKLYTTLCHAFNQIMDDDEINYLLSKCFGEQIRVMNIELLQLWTQNVGTEKQKIKLINKILKKYFCCEK